MDTTNVNITIIERPCLKLYTFGHEREEPIFYQRSRTEHDNSNMFVVGIVLYLLVLLLLSSIIMLKSRDHGIFAIELSLKQRC